MALQAKAGATGGVGEVLARLQGQGSEAGPNANLESDLHLGKFSSIASG